VKEYYFNITLNEIAGDNTPQIRIKKNETVNSLEDE
jgi:hypothetical protein